MRSATALAAALRSLFCPAAGVTASRRQDPTKRLPFISPGPAKLIATFMAHGLLPASKNRSPRCRAEAGCNFEHHAGKPAWASPSEADLRARLKQGTSMAGMRSHKHCAGHVALRTGHSAQCNTESYYCAPRCRLQARLRGWKKWGGGASTWPGRCLRRRRGAQGSLEQRGRRPGSAGTALWCMQARQRRHSGRKQTRDAGKVVPVSGTRRGL